MTKAAEWAGRVKQWRASGLRSKEFCEGRGYSATNLLWWSSYFRREGFRAVSAASGSVALGRVVRRAEVTDRSAPSGAARGVVTDSRKTAKEHLGEDPQSGALFCFANKRGNRLKVLWFDRNGFCILYKRLHRARFELRVSLESLELAGNAVTHERVAHAEGGYLQSQGRGGGPLGAVLIEVEVGPLGGEGRTTELFGQDVESWPLRGTPNCEGGGWIRHGIGDLLDDGLLSAELDD